MSAPNRGRMSWDAVSGGPREEKAGKYSGKAEHPDIHVVPAAEADPAPRADVPVEGPAPQSAPTPDVQAAAPVPTPQAPSVPPVTTTERVIRFKEIIEESDLDPGEDGWFSGYENYPQGQTNGDFLPMDVRKGFNMYLRRKSFPLYDHQLDPAEEVAAIWKRQYQKFAPYPRLEGEGPTSSHVMRLFIDAGMPAVVEAFTKDFKRPSGEKRMLTERAARKELELPPAPQMEIWWRAAMKDLRED
jgi:hypothetical protein